MTILLSTLGVAFAAFCVWLGVRIFNRRERWAKWTLAVVIGVPLLYVASFGPACWWFSLSIPWIHGGKIVPAPAIYSPLSWCVKRIGVRSLRIAFCWYATIGISKDEAVVCGIAEWDDSFIFLLHR